MPYRITPTMRLVLEELSINDQRLIRIVDVWRGRASYKFALTTSKYINMNSKLFNRLLDNGLIVALPKRLPSPYTTYTISIEGMEALTLLREDDVIAALATLADDAPGTDGG